MSTESTTSAGLAGIEISTAGAADQVRVDPALTLALAQASVAAYADFERKPVVAPANFRFVARWEGWDASIFGSKAERFGVLFQSTVNAQVLIFAFRGTDSDLDAYEDAFFETTEFVPTHGHVLPRPYVSAGFYGIYDARGTMAKSMREQLFALLAQYQPTTIYITGHSLGGALSQLFTLDVSVSSKGLWAKNMNFASPMVGTAAWKTVYESQPAQQAPATRTIRVFNYYDYAPSVPPSLFNYTHVGEPFRTAFHVDSTWWWLFPSLLARHSILNLQTVLSNAVWRNPQVWAGTFPDATAPRLMRSIVPPAGAEVPWADRLAALHEVEPSLPAAPVPVVAQG
jgi:hypothetical protein